MYLLLLQTDSPKADSLYVILVIFCVWSHLCSGASLCFILLGALPSHFWVCSALSALTWRKGTETSQPDDKLHGSSEHIWYLKLIQMLLNAAWKYITSLSVTECPPQEHMQHRQCSIIRHWSYRKCFSILYAGKPNNKLKEAKLWDNSPVSEITVLSTPLV